MPNKERWEEQGRVDRDAWLKAGVAGMLCCDVPEEYGGLGADFLFNVVVIEELARAGLTEPGFVNHSDMVTPDSVSHPRPCRCLLPAFFGQSCDRNR